MTPLCIAPVGHKRPVEAGLFNIEFVEQVFEGQQVALMTEPADYAESRVRVIGMLPERLPRVNIGQMLFDARNRHRRQRITQGDTGMGIGSRVDDDGAHALLPSGMNALDQRPFMIALKSLEIDT